MLEVGDPARLKTILALSALPAWAAVVSLVLYVVVPTIDTVQRLNTTMTQLSERLSSEAQLNELRFKAVADEQRQQDRERASLDRRLEKLEDARAHWPRGRP